MTSLAKSGIDAKKFSPTPFSLHSIMYTAIIAAIIRLALGIEAALQGDWEQLVAYGFSVIFPLVLIVLILVMGPSRTREGILMRLATMCQLTLIIAIPRFSLHLLLGLPVVFLLVELFETRLSPVIRDAISRRLVSC